MRVAYTLVINNCQYFGNSDHIVLRFFAIITQKLLKILPFAYI